MYSISYTQRKMLCAFIIGCKDSFDIGNNWIIYEILYEGIFEWVTKQDIRIMQIVDSQPIQATKIYVNLQAWENLSVKGCW